MRNININIQFTEEALEMIQKYQDISETETVQEAILDAINVALGQSIQNIRKDGD